MLKKNLLPITLLIPVLLGATVVALWVWQDDPAPEPQVPTIPTENLQQTAEQPAPEPTTTPTERAVQAVEGFFTEQLGPPEEIKLHFSAQMPASWEVEYLPEAGALNFYDPAADGANNLEKSQVFVKYFEASQFLTLSTVTIHSQEETTINGRPTVVYDIEKRPEVAPFANQPTWRNLRHRVTDIRSTPDSPTLFYVFGQRPGLDQTTFDDFIQSVQFNPESPGPSAAAESAPNEIQLPMAGFFEQVTKKRFGDFITPATSPVQPERFGGYHTGVDVETTPGQQDVDVPIFSLAAGRVVLKQTVSGYGGVVMVEHQINGETVTALYGHLRLTSVAAAVGSTVAAGEQLGLLGTGNTTETDFERKHLHFGLLRGSSQDLRGYVQNESELAAWIDPLAFLTEHGLAPAGVR